MQQRGGSEQPVKGRPATRSKARKVSTAAPSMAELQKQVGNLTRDLKDATEQQAVIAMENARLLNELRERTDDLTESLEQQTATSNVLEVISRSAFDLRAVFQTVAESAVKLCGADRAVIYRFDGTLLRIVAAVNTSPKMMGWIERNPIRPGRQAAAARAALERRTIHISDVLADPEYTFQAKDIFAVRSVLECRSSRGKNCWAL